MEKILFLVFGAIVTLLVTNFSKWIEKQNHLKKQTEIFLEFVDNIILKYLNIYIAQYDKLLEDIDKDEFFDSRLMTTSPMLNKGIFDFFEKSDLTKIFDHCKQNSLVDVYHNFYEIDFMQSNSPLLLLDKYRKTILDHFEEDKLHDETLEEHKVYCPFYKQQRELFIQEIKMYKKHSENLIESFTKVKTELKSIDELNNDGI